MNKHQLKPNHYVELRNGKRYKVVETEEMGKVLVDAKETNIYLMFHSEDMTHGDSKKDIIKVWGEPKRHANGYGWGKRYLLFEREGKE